jgi:hypothetical protein
MTKCEITMIRGKYRWLLWQIPAVVFILVIILVSFISCRSTSTEQLPEIKPWVRPPLSTEGIQLATIEPDADGIVLLGAGIAEEGEMIIINFKGPTKLIQSWNQGNVYIIDEATRIGYDQIPVAPVIGPLFGKPLEEGQPGYVMLNNFDHGIKSGSVISIILGKYKREHIIVR